MQIYVFDMLGVLYGPMTLPEVPGMGGYQPPIMPLSAWRMPFWLIS